MSSAQHTALSTVENDFEDAKKNSGLVDRKFYAGEVHNCTVEEFCEEQLEMKKAIAAGKVKPLDFQDSYRV